MPDDTIHVFLEVDVPEEKRDAFASVMGELVADAEREPGTLVYEWYFAPDGRTCHIHERYRDIPHGETHVRNFAENYGPRFFEAIGGIKAAVYGEPGAYIRGALEGAAPAYFGRTAGFNRF